MFFFFSFISLSVYFFRQMLIWPGSVIDSILFLAMAESNLPTKGEEPEVKTEFPATGKKKQPGKTSLW